MESQRFREVTLINFKRNNMKRVLLRSLLLVSILLLCQHLEAQFNGGGGTPGSGGSGGFIPGTGGGPTVPFDGGMSLVLLASGIGYAAKKLKKKQIASI